jgi:hypothetical protein
MTKRVVAHTEVQLSTTVTLQDMFNQARPEVYEPGLRKFLSCTTRLTIVHRLCRIRWCFSWRSGIMLPTEIADHGAEYFVGCVNTVLGHHLGKQLAKTDLVDAVSRH